MKKTSMILMAFALAMMMSQCKKNEVQPTSNDEVVTITLDVSKNNGSKVVVNPSTGTVDFESGDKIYVGSGGKYVGFLTHNGTNFTGIITNPTEGQSLQFYFLGNITPVETLSVGTTESCSVIISDQAEHLPVISCAPSNEVYTSNNTSYTAELQNKCALVKFNVTTPLTSNICITGMKNKVTVDFTQNAVTSSQDGEGVIMLPAGAGENVEKWAILLPQEELEEGEEGTIYINNGSFVGIRPAIPAIIENGYVAEGIEVVLLIDYVDLGLPSGTLWAVCNVGANSPEDYGDYFAWGETEPKEYYNWSNYKYCNGDWNILTKYCSNSDYGYNGFTDNLTTLMPEDDAATINWGEDWRIPTIAEWEELYQFTDHVWTTQNGVNGRLFSVSNGNSLFLPAAGNRFENGCYNSGTHGRYLSNSFLIMCPPRLNEYRFVSDEYGWGDPDRALGLSVRPVRTTSKK